MGEMQKLEFNTLPEAMRRRFVSALTAADAEARPVAAELLAQGGFMIGMLIVSAVIALVLLCVWFSGFGNLKDDVELWQGNGFGLTYIIGLCLIAYCLLNALRRFALHRCVPFKPGKYLFAFSLVDARDSELKIFDLTKASEMSAAHERNSQGNYKGTKFSFTFPDEKRQDLLVRDYDLAQSVSRELNRRRELTKAAAQANDMASVIKYDPFNEIRLGNFKPGKIVPGAFMAKPLSEFHRWRIVFALVLGVFGGVGIWYARNYQSDDAGYAEAKASKKEADYVHYVKWGRMHVQEAQDELPRVAFNEVQQAHSVTKIRALLRRYPDAGLQDEVKAEVHKMYLASVQKFRAQAADSDRALVPFMEQLLADLEASGDSTLQLRFNRPSSDDLSKMDAKLATYAASKGKIMEAAAPWFTPKSDSAREKKISEGLQRGFAAIFPSDVLQITTPAKIDPHQPLMDISYEISGSGSVYTLTPETNSNSVVRREDNRMFVGLICKFSANVSLPGQQPGWKFDLSVAPPQQFHVNFDIPANRANGEAGSASGSRVYDVMAEQAFSELNVKMRDVLFRPGTDSYRRAVLNPGL